MKMKLNHSQKAGLVLLLTGALLIIQFTIFGGLWLTLEQMMG